MATDWATRVTSWTREATPQAVSPTAVPMTKEQITFLADMVKTELFELARTVMPIQEAEALVYSRGPTSLDMAAIRANYKAPESDDAKMLEQADALVDWTVYTLNAAAKQHWNLNPVFNEVMLANEAKRWEDGTYHRRPDGKIIKPPNWMEPNLDRALPGLKN